MKLQDPLHTLILALDKQEKIYFKAHFLKNTQTDHLILFNCMEKQKVFDEQKLRIELRGKITLRRLAQMKNYLFHQVLESLTLFYSDKSAQARARNLLAKAEILMRKGMTESASGILNHALKLAENANDLLLQAAILERSGETMRGLPIHEFDRAVQIREERIKKILLSYQNLRKYQLLDDKVFNLRRKYLLPRTAAEKKIFKDILRNPLLRNSRPADSPYAYYLYCSIKGSCFHQTGDHKANLSIRKEELELLEPLAAISVQWLHRYSSALYQMAIAYRQVHQPEKVFPVLEKIYTLRIHFKKLLNRKSESVFFKRAAMVESDMYVYFGNAERGMQRLKFFDEELKRHGKWVDKDIDLVINYNLSLMCFMAGDLKQAQRRIHAILNKNEKAFAEDAVCFARIIQLIIHIELGNTDLLQYISRQTLRFLKKRKRLYKTEGIILNFCTRFLKAKRKESDAELFDWLAEEIKKALQLPNEKNVLEYFDFNAWLQARKAGITMAEVIKKRRV